MGNPHSVIAFVLLLLAFFGNASTASELVPVYMWQSRATKGLFPAVSHVTTETFTEIVLQTQAQQESKCLIAFVEPNLSPEDFASSSKPAFRRLRELVSNDKIKYLPTVSSPVESIHSIAASIPRVSLQDVTNNPKLLQKDQLIVDLNDARDDEDRTDMLLRHIDAIVEIYNAFASTKKQDVMAILTADHASWNIPSEITKKRHVRSTEEKSFLFEATEHYLFYVNGSFASKVNGTSSVFTVTKASEAQSTENLVWTTSDGKSIEIAVVYSNTSAWWSIPYVIYDSHNFSTSYGAPYNFSYSCSSNGTLKIRGQEVYLQFPTFQLQYFPEGDASSGQQRFSDSYDCVGFTSAPIWSGVFVTFILIAIMSVGLNMIMDIKTMDRFDDPKGKTIVINAAE